MKTMVYMVLMFIFLSTTAVSCRITPVPVGQSLTMAVWLAQARAWASTDNAYAPSLHRRAHKIMHIIDKPSNSIPTQRA